MKISNIPRYRKATPFVGTCSTVSSLARISRQGKFDWLWWITGRAEAPSVLPRTRWLYPGSNGQGWSLRHPVS